MRDRWGVVKGHKPWGFWQSAEVESTLDAVIDKKITFEKARKKLDVSYDALMWHMWHRRRKRGDVLMLLREKSEEPIQDGEKG